MFFARGERKKRILVVDDDFGMRQLVREILQGKGYEVLEAADGREGMEAAIKQLPDLIIMDIMMPELSGLDSVRFIRANARAKRIPIMMLTARNKVVDVEKSLDVGATDFLVKPFDVTQLSVKVEKLLEAAEPPPAAC